VTDQLVEGELVADDPEGRADGVREAGPRSIPARLTEQDARQQGMLPGFATIVLDSSAKLKKQVAGARRSLTEAFTVPPFTVLDARQGYWQSRKRAWIALGLRGEVGRGDVLPSGASSVYSGSSEWSGFRGTKREAQQDERKMRKFGRTFGQDLMRGEHKVGQNLTWVKGDRENLDDTSRKILASGAKTKMAFSPPSSDNDYDYPTDMLLKYSGTSIFDPVLCELAYRWFAPLNGSILDPFTGGPTRGFVASYLGHPYVGIDVRPEQVAANNANWTEILNTLEVTGNSVADKPAPRWMVGNSHELDRLITPTERFDLVFTCPPYYDLEIYSEMGEDGSTKQSYDEFIYWYGTIFEKAVGYLRDNRFVVVVVGEIRDKRSGAYRNFVGDTINVMRGIGLEYYNEAVLLTAVGSLPLRVGKQFGKWRKLGKGHQNVLVFWKGDLGKIAKEFPLLGGEEESA